MRRKLDANCRAQPFRTLNLNVSPVFLNDLAYNGQAKTGSFAEGARLLGRKERVEDVGKVLGWDSTPGILDFDLHQLLPIRFLKPMGSHTDRPETLSYSIHGIQKQIDNDLFDLLPI